MGLQGSLVLSSVCVLIAALLTSHSQNVRASDDTATANYLWNLEADPYETVNLYDNPDYVNIQNILEKQFADAVRDTTIECDLDDEVTLNLEKESFDDCGGVCPFTENTYKLDVEQKYSTESPPHIVFMLVDDWGYNDLGGQSSYMSWTTPTIDKLVAEGVSMSNYYTHYYCMPSRGALLTGRTANRLGMLTESGFWCQLPLSEVTIGQEMQSAGYKTYLVGKWHMGFSSLARTPEYRGFDYFYGYYTGEVDYYTKEASVGFNGGSYLDLHANGEVVTDESELDSSLHSAYLFQSKVESVISSHSTNYPSTPMFLLYAMQLVHSPYDAPAVYTDRCAAQNDDDYSQEDASSYCGLNLMLNEVVANTTCMLESTGMADNAVVILTSDNGGVSSFPGNSNPFLGHKYDFTRGGISANAFIFSKLLPAAMRGSSYNGLMHVSDWLPTLMSVATNGQWTGSYNGAELDGVNQWDAIMTGLNSPRTSIVHYAYSGDSTLGSVQYGNFKLDIGISLPSVEEAIPVTDAGGQFYTSCDSPSLGSLTYFQAISLSYFSPQSMFSAWLSTIQILSIPIICFVLYRVMQVKSHAYTEIGDTKIAI